MNRLAVSVLATLAFGGLLSAAPDDDPVVFRSDVSLVRVDAQVLDRDNRAITGLTMRDFVLRDEGKVQPIRNFASEDMPVDVLLLFDVSASMRPHVQRIASAAHQALSVLADHDRIGIMVFDRSTRVRMAFRNSRSEVEHELDRMLKQESFRGGTDITRALYEAADYVKANGRRDARRAIVILTDDMTEFDRDEAGVGRALVRADAVLSALIAPDAMGNRGYGGQGGGYPRGGGGGGYPGGGGGYPGGGGGVSIGIPGLGGIGGRRGGYGGRGPGGGNYPGGGGGGRTKSAGTSEIARDSGGDSLPVDDASALETTLSRLRQRYALHFLVPPGARKGEERNIEVALADTARRRYPDADVRFRRTYVSPGSTAGGPSESVDASAAPSRDSDPVLVTPDSTPKRRRAVSEPDGSRSASPTIGAGTTADSQSSSTTSDPDRPTLRRVDQPNSSSGPLQPADAPGRWRKLKPGEQPATDKQDKPDPPEKP